MLDHLVLAENESVVLKRWVQKRSSGIVLLNTKNNWNLFSSMVLENIIVVFSFSSMVSSKVLLSG